MSATLPLCQLALSTVDLAASFEWYRSVFGLLPSAPRRHAEGPAYARVPGLPDASFDVAWLVDAQPWFQLEMFQFALPPMKRRRSDAKRSDVGYAAIVIYARDFEATLARAPAAHIIAPPLGAPGQRCALLRDPDGNFVEVLENDPAAVAGAGTSIRAVTLSVPDLSRAIRFWGDTLGLLETDAAKLRSAARDALWASHGAPLATRVLRSGDVFLELVEYPADAQRARIDGYLISDQGILNVALGSKDKAEFDAVYERAISAGYRSNTPPWTAPGLATVVYLNDDQGFSVELLHVESPDRMGFVAAKS